LINLLNLLKNFGVAACGGPVFFEFYRIYQFFFNNLKIFVKKLEKIIDKTES